MDHWNNVNTRLSQRGSAASLWNLCAVFLSAERNPLEGICYRGLIAWCFYYIVELRESLSYDIRTPFISGLVVFCNYLEESLNGEKIQCTKREGSFCWWMIVNDPIKHPFTYNWQWNVILLSRIIRKNISNNIKNY